jgi:SAM-dependent methyltransferase
MSASAVTRVSLKKRLFQVAWPALYVVLIAGKWLYSVGLSYRFQMEWGSLPMPEWFDHEYDLAFFPRWRKSHFFERGVYLQEILRKNDVVLDLCCGDGSVTALFIAPEVLRVVGVDFDPHAIAAAKGKFAGYSNVSFQVEDIRSLKVAKSEFDVVTWDAAIEHFTQEEMNAIFASIRSVMKPGGLLAGSTVAKQAHVQHHDHEFEFDTPTELQTFLGGHFKNVTVWERVHEDRTSYYFRCDDGATDLRARARSV